MRSFGPIVLALLILSAAGSAWPQGKPAPAAAAKATAVGGHFIGETFDAFLSNAGKQGQLDDCHNGKYEDDRSLYLRACVDSGLVPAADGTNASVASPEDEGAPTFLFNQRRLVGAHMRLGARAAALPSLRAKYGRPLIVERVPARGAPKAAAGAGAGGSGALWHAEWRMPDGTSISAVEFGSGGDGDSEKQTSVVFVAPGRFADAAGKTDDAASPH